MPGCLVAWLLNRWSYIYIYTRNYAVATARASFRSSPSRIRNTLRECPRSPRGGLGSAPAGALPADAPGIPKALLEPRVAQERLQAALQTSLATPRGRPRHSQCLLENLRNSKEPYLSHFGTPLGPPEALPGISRKSTNLKQTIIMH